MPLGSDAQRFLTLADVAEILNISDRQTYALVRRGELPAIRIGGRGQWRVEAAELENYISAQYTATQSYIDAHPFGDNDQERPAT
ncbi:MAG: helix-turn-helix domain-containing protein [Nocardioidaceae bacterium]